MNTALILAGGQGVRMGGDVPKQYRILGDRPVLMHALGAFEAHAQIDALCVVCPAEWQEKIRQWQREYGIQKLRWLTRPGTSRRASVYQGLQAIEADASPEDIVLIHDGVRPLVSQRIIGDCLQAAHVHGAANTVIDAQDSILFSTDGQTMTGMPRRGDCRQVQTPQGFVLSLILRAHRQVQLQDMRYEATDDCSLVFELGHRVALIQGEPGNIKLTTPTDWTCAQALLAQQQGQRTGQ